MGRTGRVRERRRFISGGPGARESALTASRVVLDDDQWIVEGLKTKMEKPASTSIPPSWRFALCGSTVVASPVLAAGPGVKIFSSWKPKRG